MIPVEFHVEAELEFLDAVDHYRMESRNAAEGFVAEVRATIDRIAERPLTGSPGEAGTRRKYLHRYPYTIIYRTTGSYIQIVAVMHQRREPMYWGGRL